MRSATPRPRLRMRSKAMMSLPEPAAEASPERPCPKLAAEPPPGGVLPIAQSPSPSPGTTARRANNNIAKYNESRRQDAARRRAAVPPGSSWIKARTVWRWSKGMLYWPTKLVNWGPAMLLLVCACMPAAVFPRLSRNFEAGTTMFEQLANMTGAAATTASIITTSVGAVALGTSESVLSVAHEMWKGVDLANVSLHLDLGKCVVLHADSFAQLVKDDVSHNFGDMPQVMQNDLMELVTKVNEWKPLLQLERRQVLVRGALQSLEALAMLLPGGFLGVTWRWAVAAFAVSWANPLWTPLFDSEAELEQIVRLLAAAIVEMGGASWRLPLRADVFADLPIFTPTWWQWVVVQSRRIMRWAERFLSFVLRSLLVCHR